MLYFTSIYIVILLKSVSLGVVWAMIVYHYPQIRSARYWLLALLLTCPSGALLLLGASVSWPTSLGLALVSGSFSLMWQHPPPAPFAALAGRRMIVMYGVCLHT